MLENKKVGNEMKLRRLDSSFRLYKAIFCTVSLALIPAHFANGQEEQVPAVLSASPVTDSMRSVANWQLRREELFVLAAKLTSSAVVDTMQGLSEAEKELLLARYRILHPIE